MFIYFVLIIRVMYFCQCFHTACWWTFQQLICALLGRTSLACVDCSKWASYKIPVMIVLVMMKIASQAMHNTQPLRLRSNCSLVFVLRRSCGGLFQIVGPHTQKLCVGWWCYCGRLIAVANERLRSADQGDMVVPRAWSTRFGCRSFCM